VDPLTEDSLRLKALVEFGSANIYSIRNGGLGQTLYINAGTKSRAREVRTKVPLNWEGLYVIVLYTSIEEEKKDDLSLS